MAEGLTVLIVDEDPDSRVATRKALQRANLGIAGESGYGTQAVSLALQTMPDIVLVCAEEPVERPLETAESLANAVPDTPIIIYSSTADTESVRRGMVFGARDYLVKPLQGAQLREAAYRALEQEERRQMRRSGQLSAETGRGTVIVVTGAKGGIGKSVTAVNLALALRLETGKSVALVDADTQFGDIATLLDIVPAMTAADVLRDSTRFTRATASDFLTRHSSGLNVLAVSGDADPWLACDDDTWRLIIDTLAGLHEFVLIDTSGAFDRFVQRAFDSASLVLLVTTGEVSSVRDTGAAIRRLQGWGVDVARLRVVFNRGARATEVTSKDLAQSIGQEIFWELPDDKAVPRSVQVGRPVVLDSGNNGFGRSIRALALRIAGTKRSLVAQPQSRSLLQKLSPFRGRNNGPIVAAPELEP
jgi:pilus assembly protein CpaE